jgi:hypothetical protein
MLLKADDDTASLMHVADPHPHFEEFDSTAAAAADAGHDGPRTASAVESQALALKELGHPELLHSIAPPPSGPPPITIKIMNCSRWRLFFCASACYP